MSSSLYDVLPEPPAQLSAAGIIVRMIDGLAFRYRWALDGLDTRS